MNELINFLSECPFFQNEKNLILHLEAFLKKQFSVNPLLVLSIQDKFSGINLSKCRSVLGKNENLLASNTKLLNDLIAKHNNLKTFRCLSVKGVNSFHHYLNLGVKKDQFYFVFFSSDEAIPEETLEALSKYITGHLKIIEKFDELYKSQELIHIDDVTGLYNQRKLYKDLDSLIAKYKTENDPFCVLFIDIDHFKKVNDNYGHLVGTKLLENVAKDVTSLLRDSDIGYRYGGDEFVIILVGANGQSGKIVGERILAKIRSTEYAIDISNEKRHINLSVSIGVAEFPNDAKNPQEVLAIADRMMYEAKESGRGLVFNTQDIFKSSLKKVVQK